MEGYIYLNTDLKTGKQYTGQHHYHKEGELDPNYHGSGVLWKRVLKKRPKELIKEEYIKTCYSQEELDESEKYYTKLFKTLYPNGYNLTEGGEGCKASEETRKKISEKIKEKYLYDEDYRRKISEAHKNISDDVRRKYSEARKKLYSSGEKHPMLGRQHSEESKKKMSDSHKFKPSPNKGKPMSEEQKRKISESHKGKPSPNKGKPMSEEQKKKLSNVLKGKMIGEKNPFYGKHHSDETLKKISKRVLQLTPDGELVKEWLSTKECGRNGFSQGHVAACCRGERKSHKGFLWQYKE